LKISAEFIRSAASARDLPADGLPELAMVGRSNVGKSSIINALARQRVARTSGTPGKTRLANIYRVARGSAKPFYLADLPGFGFAKGRDSEREFAELTNVYFGARQVGYREHAGQELPSRFAALLLVDARHPGLENDRRAWEWLASVGDARALVATKIDKLAHGQRIRAMRAIESVFDSPVLPVSAVTGEGLDELWKLIDRLLNSQHPNPPQSSSLPPRETAPPLTRSPQPEAATKPPVRNRDEAPNRDERQKK
jgi:GTP-binding protein